MEWHQGCSLPFSKNYIPDIWIGNQEEEIGKLLMFVLFKNIYCINYNTRKCIKVTGWAWQIFLL